MTAAAQAFLAYLDPDATFWTFQTFDDDRDEKRPKLARIFHGTLEQQWPALERLNAQGAGVYVTISETDGNGRSTENITRVRAVFADFDTPDTETPKRLLDDPLPPSMIVESSPGKYHAYWLVDGVLPLERFKPLQQAIIAAWGSDPTVCDLSRVMRLPDFQHRKGEAQPVRLIECDGHRYSPEQLASRYPIAERPQATGLLVLGGEPTAYGRAALASACKAVADTLQGGRNHALNREAFSVAQLVAGGEIPEQLAREMLTAAAEQAGLETAEIERTLNSAWRKGVTTPRAPSDTDAVARAAFGGAVVAPAEHGTSAALVEVPLGDVMSATLEPVRFAVNLLIPRRHVTLFAGHGGIGKSSLALAIGAHVACGLPFGGLPVEQLPVLFVSLEDEASIVRLRLRRIIEEYWLPAERVLAGVRLLDGTQAFSALMTEGDGFNAPPIFTPAFRELASHAEGAGLIFIDNASDAFDANENSRRTVRAFIRGLAAIARNHDAAVVLLAHIDKVAAKGGGNGNNYSGSTAWHNSARSRLALMETDGRILLVHEKANLSALADPMPFAFVNSVPVPEVFARGDRLTAECFDQGEIIRAMQAARGASITINASTSAGAYSAMKSLEPLPEYSTTFKGKDGSRRAVSAITALIRSGKIIRVSYKTDHRKSRERLELVDAAL